MIALWAAVGLFWSKFYDFRGRSSPSQFWLAMGFVAGFTLIAIALDILLYSIAEPVPEGIVPRFAVATVWGILATVPTVSIAWRRLHDAGHSGWWVIVPPGALVVSVLLTENTAGDSWTPFATVFFAVLTLTAFATLVILLLRPSHFVPRPLLTAIATTLVLSLGSSLALFPVVSEDGAIDYSKVSTFVGLGPLWERTFPASCGEFGGSVTNLGRWQEPITRETGWGRVRLSGEAMMPSDRLSCYQILRDSDSRRGFLFQRADEDTWRETRENLTAQGFSHIEIWGTTGLSRVTEFTGEPHRSETEVIFYGAGGVILYTWTNEGFWLRDSYRALLTYVGGISELSGGTGQTTAPTWQIGDIDAVSCVDFQQTLEARMGVVALSGIEDDEWANRGAPRTAEDPGEYVLCSHPDPDDFHSGRGFRIQPFEDIEGEYRALVDDGFEPLRIGEFWGLFREQTIEPSEDSHGSWIDEVYLFAADGWVYFVTNDDVLTIDDPYLDIPRQIIRPADQE